MGAIRGTNTKPELELRRALHRQGLRYRLHAKDLPGRPDIIFPKHRTVLFVHGCFWHRHEGCRYATTPSTRPEFWKAKFDGNTARDEAATEALLRDHWRVGIVWECLAKRGQLEEAAEEIAEFVTASESPFAEWPVTT